MRRFRQDPVEHRRCLLGYLAHQSRGVERIKGMTGRLRGLLPFARHLITPAQDHVWTLAPLETEVCHPRASAHQRPLVEGSRATSSGLTHQQASECAFHVDRHQPWLAWPSLNLRRFVSVCGFGVLRARGPHQSLESQDRYAQQCHQGSGQAQTLGTNGASPWVVVGHETHRGHSRQKTVRVEEPRGKPTPITVITTQSSFCV